MFVLLLSLLPLALVVRLGSHSRLTGDDFCHLVSGMEYGPWGNVLYWRNSYNGSFSYYFLHGLTAPLDTLAPSLFVVIILLAWLFGLVWLIAAGRRLLGRESLPLAQATLVAAALLWFSINGLPTSLSIYFYSGSTRHTLPIAILLIALAACCEFIPRLRSSGRLALGCLIFAMVAFVNAGMSEVFAVLQLALLSALLPAVYMMIPQERRRNCYAFIMSGWAAIGLALLVMTSAPGVARRLASFQAWTSLPQRSPADILSESLAHLQSLFIDLDLNAGFIGMFALGLFLMLAFHRPAPASPSRKPFQLAAPPFLLFTLAQLLLTPFVWTSQSANPLVIGTSLLLLLSGAAVLLARPRLNAILLKTPIYWAAIPGLTLAMIVLLFSLAQWGQLARQAATIVSFNIFLLLIVLLWQFHFRFRRTRQGQFFAPAIWVFLVTCACAFIAIGLNKVIHGGVYLYTLSFLSFAAAFSGFIGGIALAYAINQENAATPAIRPTRALLFASAIVAGAIWVGSFLGNAGGVTDSERFSQAWDARHQLILSKRAEGERLTEVPQLAPDISGNLGYYGRTDYWQSSCASADITALIIKKYRA